MKRIVLALMLISPFSFADWGDVYYCQMTTHSKASLEGKRTDHELEKFQFKLDKTKNAMVFGKIGVFGNTVIDVREELLSEFSIEVWHANGLFIMAYFEKGKFLLSMVGNPDITAISADCDKF